MKIKPEDLALQMGKLKLVWNDKDRQYHVVHPVKDAQSPAVYTVAFITPDSEQADMKTVGRRPWKMEDTTVEQFMFFCQVAMTMIDDSVEVPS